MPIDRGSRGPFPPVQTDGRSPGLPAPGDVIAGKYEVEQQLGEGGMGIVVAARHMQLGRRVAIKFMRAEVAQDYGAVERFLREARAAVACVLE